MPTPSPNQPPEEPASPNSHLFSTCPDEPQHSPQHGSIDVRRNSALNGLSLASPESEQPQDTHGRTDRLIDNLASMTPSSRGTTVSPRPRSNTTGVTSPEHGPDASHLFKSQEIDPDGPSSQSQNSARFVELHGQASKELDIVDAALVEEEDAACTPPSMGSDYSSSRAIPLAPSSYLRSGSKFHGTQQSERQVYDVQVEIKHVDMRESFLCGYLRIQGLTEDHPTLTTYFEGEIIGSKYSFFTQHEDWGANAKVDLSHWGKFSAFRPFQKHARKGPVNIPDVTQNEHVFMRWKEHFLVPDHRVRTITGASFEGFYYICFNQLRGEVSGIYFHSKSEK
ncbi:hypothetical protein QQS21_002431 [Conoideocrella luteorostrata]|uniref:Vesicle-mediated transporter Vid24 n=1 Tax=Conoideocrella luteorostrata TaxID=1105319 RepID=A0AAJ0CVE0_9HYPO|nr:hypothetical protein QQS21_002431 [Conoideocrella luteorostrata]